MRVGYFSKAIELYSCSIAASDDEDNETLGRLYSNRSLCYLKEGHVDMALVDAEISALHHRPNWPKAHLRVATAHLALGEPKAALFYLLEAARLGGRQQLDALFKEATMALEKEEASYGDESSAVVRACEAWGHTIGLSKACRIQESPGAGCGLFAAKDMESDAVVASIPLQHTLADARSCNINPSTSHEDSPFLGLLLQLATQMRTSCASPVSPGSSLSSGSPVGRNAYLRLLRQGLPASALIFPRDLLESCGDPELTKEVLRLRDSVKVAYMRMRASDRGVLRGSFYHTLEAMLLWYSRALPMGAEATSAVVPFIDLLNHEPNAPNAYMSFPPGAGTVEVRSLHPVASGEEIRISYAGRKNRHWLLHFGFVPDANPEEEVAIPLEVETSRACRECLLSFDLPGEMDLVLRPDGFEFTPSLKAWLYIVTQDDQTHQEWGKNGSMAGRGKLEELSVELSCRAWGILDDSCSSWIEAQPPLLSQRLGNPDLVAVASEYVQGRRRLVAAAGVQFKAQMTAQRR